MDKPPMAVIPYIVGVSEDIKCVCGKFGARVVFRSGQILHSMLTRVKDTLVPDPHRSSKVYIGETR